MTASMLLEVVAADGSAIDRAGKMDCTRGGNGDTLQRGRSAL